MRIFLILLLAWFCFGQSTDQLQNTVTNVGSFSTLQAAFDNAGTTRKTFKLTKPLSLTQNTTQDTNITLTFSGQGKIITNGYNYTANGDVFPTNLNFQCDSVDTIIFNRVFLAHDYLNCIDVHNNGRVRYKKPNISVRWYMHADSNRITDAWSHCIWAIEQAGGGVINIPYDTNYTHSNYTSGLESQMNGPLYGVTINGNGSKIKYTNTIAIRDPFIEFFDIINLKISDLRIDGNVQITDAGAGIICKLLSCDNFTVDNVYFYNAQYDCFYLGAQETPTFEGECEGGLVNNFRFSAGQRNNISIIAAKDVTFMNGRVDDNANTSDSAAPKLALDLEPSISGAGVYNITFQNVIWDNNNAGPGSITSVSPVEHISFINNYFIQKLDQNSNCYSFDSTARFLYFQNCYQKGYGVVESNAIWDGCSFVFDDSITVIAGGANNNLRITEKAFQCVIRNCVFENSATSNSVKFITFSDRNTNTFNSSFVFENNTFRAVDSLLGTKIIDLGSINSGDIVYYKMNRFEQSGSVPVTPYYILGPVSKSIVRLGEGNVFEDNFKLDNTPIGWPKEANQYNSYTKSKQKRISLSGASVTWTNPIPDGAVLVSTKAEISTAIVLSGGASWRVGDGSDADRWGTSSTLTVGEILNTADWTADTNTPVMSETSIVLTPDAGTFTSGVVDVEFIYLILD